MAAESNESPLPAIDVPEALQDAPELEAKRRKLNGTQPPGPSSSTDRELEVEVVQADEFAFLDGVNRFSILQTGAYKASFRSIYIPSCNNILCRVGRR